MSVSPSYEKKYELLLESCPVAVWIEDFTGVAKWFEGLRNRDIRDLRSYLHEHPEELHAALARIRVIEVNNEAVHQSEARDKAELIARLPELFTAESSEVFIEELALLYQGNRVINLETFARTLNGKRIYIVMRIQVPGTPEQPDWGNVIITGTDITERREMEQKLRASMREAQSANDAKSRFLAHMSHELRTPMNSILGMADLLLETPLQPEQTELVRTLQSSCRTLLGILNDILDLSRIEANRMRIEPHPVRLREIIADVADLLATGAREKSLKFIALTDANVPHWVLADEMRVRQILFNLAGNSVKFTHRGHVKIHVCRHEDHVRFQVSDTGIGIEPENLGKLFLPFEQGEAGTTRRYGGTGLGLTIVHQLVAIMGGRITVNSTPGQGSCFTVDLPLQELDGENYTTPKVPADFCCELSVNDPDDRQMLAEYLQAFGIPTHNHPHGDVERCTVEICDFSDAPSADSEVCAASSRRNLYAVLSPGVSVRHEVVNEKGLRGVLPLPLRHTRFLQLLEETRAVRHIATSRSRKNRVQLPDRSLHVLVAEDNPNNQLVIRLSLRKLGVDAVLVEDGLAAVEAIRRANGKESQDTQPFDLVILDFQMPRMDGMQAAAEIQELPLRIRPYLAALTANAFPEDRRRALKHGFQSYLTKPLIPGQLRELLDLARKYQDTQTG